MRDTIHDPAEQADLAVGALGAGRRPLRLWVAAIAGTCVVVLAVAVGVAMMPRPGAGVAGADPSAVGSDRDTYFVGELTDKGDARGVAISPDGEILAVGMGEDHTVELWDAHTGRTLRTLHGESVVDAVAFSPDGKLLATGSDIFDVASGGRLSNFAGGAYDVEFSPDGTLIATANGTVPDGVNLYDSSTGALAKTLTTDHASSVSFSPDGSLLAFSITIYDNNSARLPGVPGEIGWSGTVLWRVGTDEKVSTLENEYVPIFSRDGSLLATTNYDEGVRLRDPGTGELVRDLPVSAGLGFGADGAIFVGSSGSQLLVVDPETGTVRRTLEGVGSQTAVVSPDGRRVLVIGRRFAAGGAGALPAEVVQVISLT